MKKIFKTLLIFVIFAGMVSCEDYIDVNQNPNDPDSSVLTPNNLLSASQTELGALYAVDMNTLGGLMSVVLSADFNNYADPYGEEFRYEFTSQFYDQIWDEIYQTSNNLTLIENYEDDKNWDNHKAVAKILKAFYFQYIVDLYGDSPYSEMHQGNILFPSYDDAATTYRALVDLIDEAVGLIDNAPNTAQGFSGSDVMLNGNMATWKRFANTVKLRLLIRQTELAGTDGAVDTYITSEFNELQSSGAQFITSNVSMNPGYTDADDRQNPFYEEFGYDAAGIASFYNGAAGPSEYSFDFLDNTNDPRINRFWQPNNTNGSFQGTQQAAPTGAPASFGPAFIVEGQADMDVVLMLASESYFLQAEAIQRGYMTGNAQTAFNNGINASFSHLGIPGDAAGYIASIAATPNLGWTGDLIESIITQKYIASILTSGIESWIEYNRTGFPDDLPLPNGSLAPNIPVRLLYPASEHSGNTNNVPSQTSADIFSARVFWDVN